MQKLKVRLQRVGTFPGALIAPSLASAPEAVTANRIMSDGVNYTVECHRGDPSGRVGEPGARCASLVSHPALIRPSATGLAV